MTSCDPLPGAVEHQEAVAVCVGLLAKHAADMVSGVIAVCSEAGVNPRQGVNPRRGLIQGRGVHVLCECMGKVWEFLTAIKCVACVEDFLWLAEVVPFFLA